MNPITFSIPTEVDISQAGPFLQVPGVLLCVLDSNGLILQSSPNWEDILGYSRDDLAGLSISDLIHPSDLENSNEGERWLQGSATPHGFVCRCKHKDGAYRWLRWHTNRQRADGKVYTVAVDLSVSANSPDLDERISAQRNRQAADQLLFEANPNPMWVYDRETLRFLEVNDAAVNHYGYSRAEFLAMTLLDIRPKEDRDTVLASVAKNPAAEAPSVWTHILKDGRPIQVEVLVRNIDYRGYHARLASIKDVTEQQQAQALLHRETELLEQRVAERTKQLVDANTELEAFCFSVSHDLRSPLRSIDGFTHGVLNQHREALGEEGRADLERVRRASQRMSELIDGLLGLARLTRQELRLQSIDVSAMARQIHEELRQEHPHRKVNCRIQDDLHEVADPRLVRMLLHNLFSNSWKFTANRLEAEIIFEGKPSGAEFIYSIRDNGAGFDMAYVDKLFQPFQRLHHTTEFPGNGVGLATVKRIVNRHGGRAFAHGLVNHGATVYFTLRPPEID